MFATANVQPSRGLSVPGKGSAAKGASGMERPAGSRRPARHDLPPLFLLIVLANFGVLAAATAMPSLRADLALMPDLVLRGQVWRLFTYAWVHAGLGHLVGNMLLLMPFALYLEMRYGRAVFATSYFVSSALAGLILFLKPEEATIGASGAVCAIVMLSVLGLVHKPDRPAWVFIPELLLGLLVLVLWLAPTMFGSLMGLFRHDGISHLGHLGGFISGFILYRTGILTLARPQDARPA